MPSPLAYNRDYALNAICPYFTMFPLEFPLQVMGKHKRYFPTVVDPFCGRGTTLYAARKLGLASYGFDTSPIAVAIAKAKLASASVTDIMALATQFLKNDPSDIPGSEFFQKAYSPETLRQICSLREGLLDLDNDSNEAVLLRAAILGCLHGPRAKNIAQSGYFSNQMPRTFASKPGYSVSYWKKNNFLPPEVSVLDVIRRKLERIAELSTPSISNISRVKCADARLAANYRNMSGRLLVITSPPYYGMRTYVQDQWLRNWFLGGSQEINYDSDVQLRHSGHEAFVHDLSRVWTNLRNRASGIDLYVRFGTIPSVKSDARELMRASLEESGGWRLLYTKKARTASEGKRQADQMQGDSSAAEEFDFHAAAI